jgi:hypothetical protein
LISDHSPKNLLSKVKEKNYCLAYLPFDNNELSKQSKEVGKITQAG